MSAPTECAPGTAKRRTIVIRLAQLIAAGFRDSDDVTARDRPAGAVICGLSLCRSESLGYDSVPGERI